ncbi:hypothetical protein DL765_008922 [Monosporascus sp. GIB2]|nr:hypothetical protein DL765_008922 [Monosporascus sp. GIB2]
MTRMLALDGSTDITVVGLLLIGPPYHIPWAEKGDSYEELLKPLMVNEQSYASFIKAVLELDSDHYGTFNKYNRKHVKAALEVLESLEASRHGYGGFQALVYPSREDLAAKLSSPAPPGLYGLVPVSSAAPNIYSTSLRIRCQGWEPHAKCTRGKSGTSKFETGRKVYHQDLRINQYAAIQSQAITENTALAARIIRTRSPHKPFADQRRLLLLHTVVVRRYSNAASVVGSPDPSECYHRTVKLPGGRTLAWAEAGSPTGFTCFLPGYGLSTFQPNRRLLDWPADVRYLARHFDLKRYSVLGGSVGGPRTPVLACAYAIPPDELFSVGLLRSAAPWEAGNRDVLWSARLGSWASTYCPSLSTRLLDLVLGMPKRFTASETGKKLIDGIAAKAAATADKDIRESEKQPEAVAARRERLLRISLEPFAQDSRGFVQEAYILTHLYGFRLEDVQFERKVKIWHGTKEANSQIRMTREPQRDGGYLRDISSADDPIRPPSHAPRNPPDDNDGSDPTASSAVNRPTSRTERTLERAKRDGGHQRAERGHLRRADVGAVLPGPELLRGVSPSDGEGRCDADEAGMLYDSGASPSGEAPLIVYHHPPPALTLEQHGLHDWDAGRRRYQRQLVGR